MNVNLNLYKYFYEVAKYKSYTQAATNLYVSQPSLSYSIKSLENQLGYKLFERTNNKLELTTNGKKLFETLQPMVNELMKIESIPKIKNKRIGVLAAWSVTSLPKILFEFSNEYPNIEIEYITGDNESLANFLEKGDVDLIITERKQPSFESIETGLSYQTCLFTSKNQNIDFISGEDLEKEEIYIVSHNDYCKDFMKRNPQYKYVDFYTTPDMVYSQKRNNKIGFVVKSLIEDDIELQKLKVLNTNIDLPKIPLFVSTKKNYNYTKDEFINFLINYKN